MEVGHRGRRIGDRVPRLVRHPALRHRPAEQVEDLDLVRGDRAGRHVQYERRIAPRGRGERDRVGGQARERTTGRYDAHHLRRRRDQADQPGLGRHRGVVAGRAEVVGVAHRHHPDTGRAGHPDRQLHRGDGGRMTESPLRVDQRHRGGPADDLRLRVEPQPSRAPQLLVGHQHRYPVRIDPGQVGVGHHRGRGHDLLRCHPPRRQHAGDLGPDGVRRETEHVHGSPHLGRARRSSRHEPDFLPLDGSSFHEVRETVGPSPAHCRDGPTVRSEAARRTPPQSVPGEGGQPFSSGKSS